MKTNYRCPKCKSDNLEHCWTTKTNKHYPRVIVNGENINPDRNIITTECLCLDCKIRFKIITQYGEKDKILWDSKKRGGKNYE